MLPPIYDPEKNKFVLPPLPYDYGANDEISKETDEFHHDKHFSGYITELNAFDEKMAKMCEEGNFAGIRAAMLAFSHNASGAYLHNIYYAILGGDGKADESLDVVQAIAEDFGSFETWQSEFKAVAKAARGWAILGFFEADGKLRHNMVDFHDQQVAYGMKPIIACDVWEHAYYYDQGPDRAKYIDAFLDALDWKKIDALFSDCMGGCCGGDCKHQ